MPSAWVRGIAAQLNPATNGPGFEGQLDQVRRCSLPAVFNGNGAEMHDGCRGRHDEKRLQDPADFRS